MFGNNLVSIYNGITDIDSQHVLSVSDALSRIRVGRSIGKVEKIRQTALKPLQDEIKLTLPAVTWSGVFLKRKDEALLTHSGFICLDFDNVHVAELAYTFQEWRYTYAYWLSPRGGGLKLLVKIADGSKHRDHYRALQEIYPQSDNKCINQSRLCFESYDPNLFINENSEIFADAISEKAIYKNIVRSEKGEVFKKLQRWAEDSGQFFSSGNRNQFIYILASAMCRFGIMEDDTEAFLASEYLSSDNTFTSKEARDAIKSAYKSNAKNWNTAEFSREQIVSTETKYAIDVNILEEGFKPSDVIYGTDVQQDALEIYHKGYLAAETTFIPALDKYFKFKKMELTILTGIGNYGKSLYLMELLLIQSLKAGKKWAIFSPENFPASNFFFDLTETLLGTRCDGGYDLKPSIEKYNNAYKFVSDHFFYVYPETISPSPEYIKTKFLELIIKEKVEGVLIDPFNQLTNNYKGAGGRSDKYLETFLSDCLRFAQQNNVFFFIIAHPKQMQKGNDGNYPCPDRFDLADGAMWNNKADNILVYHRPYAQTDPMNAECEHHSKKIRRQKIIGERGQFTFALNRSRRRFYFNGFSPLDGNIFESPPPPEQLALKTSRIADEREHEEPDGDVPF